MWIMDGSRQNLTCPPLLCQDAASLKLKAAKWIGARVVGLHSFQRIFAPTMKCAYALITATRRGRLMTVRPPLAERGCFPLLSTRGQAQWKEPIGRRETRMNRRDLGRKATQNASCAPVAQVTTL